MLKEKKIFAGGGMDLDTDTRYTKPNMYGYALNCLANNSNSSNVGCIENRKGNTLVNFALPNGNNKCVGAVKDINKNAIVYFIYNDQRSHCILRYNIKSKTIDEIVFGNVYLNFQKDIIITSINIIGDLLYWTDGYFNRFTYNPANETPNIGFNPPRMLNMQKAYNLTNNVIVAPLYKYETIDFETIDAIKYPPTNKVIAEYATDDEKKYNFLVGKLFQFSIRYVYDNNEVSTLSPISDVPIPLNQEDVGGKYSDKLPKLNNVINLGFNSGSHIVKQIKLYVREQNTGDWYLFDTLNKYDSSGEVIINHNNYIDYSYTNGYGFYNNNVLIEADQSDMARPFDYVGQVVDTQTVINNNRVVHGGIVENYDNIDIDVELQWETQQIDFSNLVNTYNGSLVGNYIWNTVIGFNVLITLPQNATGDASYEISITVDRDDDGTVTTDVITYSTTIQPSDIYPFTLRDRLIQIIIDSGSYAWVGGANEIHVFVAWLPDVVNNYVSSKLSVIKKVEQKVGFKKGFLHKFALQYSDRAGRSGALNKSNNSEIYIPFDTETIYANMSLSFRDVHDVLLKIKHIPPEWATHYQWFYAKQTPKFVQYYYTKTSLLANGNIHINVNECLSTLKTNRQNTVLTNWSFKKGDRMRFIATGQFLVPNIWWFHPDFIDTEIVDIDIATGVLIIQDIGYTSKRIKLPNGWDYGIVEIYSPQKIEDETNFYAIGDINEIGNPHTSIRYHKSLVNQNPSNPEINPAEGRLKGDIYVRGRYSVEPPVIPIESEMLSDYYDSDAISIGKVSSVIPDIKRQKYTKLRYSGQLLEDTKINNLSRFDYLNTEEIGNEYGDITSLNQMGYTLKVLQQNKNTSIDIGIQQLTGGAGDSISVISSTKILGSPRISQLNYGCQNPESVLVNDRYMYFYDQNYGVFLRDAANGMTAISDLGMKSFFRRKRQEIIDADYSKVITGFDKRFNEVIVSFITTQDDRKVPKRTYKTETVVFCEDSNTWTTFLSYEKKIPDIVPIDYMTNNGETLVTFMNGELYLENSNIFGYFFGEQKPMIVDVIANIEQEKVKVFNSIGLTTNLNLPDGWFVESVIVPPTDQNPTGHYTTIPSSRFRHKEEALYADIPRDIYSPIQGTDMFKMVNGRVMRGQVVTFRLVNNTDRSVVLYSTIIKSNPSEMSK